MLRLSSRLCGTYLLNQRVLADWWQPRYRERVHDAAKEKLTAALQASAHAGHAPSPAGEAETSTVVDPASGDAFEGDSSSSSSAPPLSLYDANALVATFVSSHNTEDLSATLQYIREHLGEDLTPFHFHALLRNFNYQHDHHNSLQLLEVMVRSGTMTLETYARMADCVHVLSPPDAQARLLHLVELAQEAFGGQVMLEDAGSEGKTTASYSNNDEGRLAREAEAAAGATIREKSTVSADTRASSTFATQSAPLLSSLLYHVSSTENANTAASCFLVALWIRALGVELSDWDVLAVLSSVLTHPEQFPRLCLLFGSFEGIERGHVSAQAVLDRLSLVGEVDTQELVADPKNEGSSGGNSSAQSCFTYLARAMRRSLHAAGGDAALTAVVPLSFVNAQTSDLEELVLGIMRPLMQHGVGPHRYNAGHMLHALSLVNSAIRDDVGAVEMLVRSIQEQERQEKASTSLSLEQEQQQQHIGSVCATASELPLTVPPASSPGLVGEPFAVPVHHLIDMGTLLHRMSASKLREVQRPFRHAIRRLVGELSEEPGDTSNETEDGSWRSFTASCRPPIPAARELVKLSNYETQFILTIPEAREALRHAVDSGNAAGGHGRLPRSTQLMFLQLAEFCCRHPPRNPKLTPAGLEERAKWARYLDARDTSLALFGSARQSRDSMKHLFYHDNQLPALRSDAVIAKDFMDVHRIFFGSAIPQPSSPASSQAELQQALLRTRTTLPHTGSSEASVPRYLWDPTVFNPYPAAQLANNSCVSHRAFSSTEINQLDPALGEVVEEGDGGDGSDASAFFVELWMALLDKTTSVGNNEVWYLQNTGMYLLLVRCLLHRLDWEAAVHLTRKMTQHATYNHIMDHELTTIFKEIGDPAGCLAFKVATKLFDGRITKDGQSKRERFHQEQFSA